MSFEIKIEDKKYNVTFEPKSDNTLSSSSPLFSYNCYKRVLISSAATSALRLHQRLPVSMSDMDVSSFRTMSMLIGNLLYKLKANWIQCEEQLRIGRVFFYCAAQLPFKENAATVTPHHFHNHLVIQQNQLTDYYNSNPQSNWLYKGILIFNRVPCEEGKSQTHKPSSSK